MKGLSVSVGPFIFFPGIKFDGKTVKLLRYGLPPPFMHTVGQTPSRKGGPDIVCLVSGDRREMQRAGIVAALPAGIPTQGPV